MDVERYLRIPFVERGADWSGCNCWGLVVLAYREELGIALPAHPGIGAADLKGAKGAISAAVESDLWPRASEPRDFDVAILRGLSVAGGQSFSVTCHVGLIVGRGTRLLHTEEGVGVSCPDLDDRLVKWRINEVRRYAGQSEHLS